MENRRNKEVINMSSSIRITECRRPKLMVRIDQEMFINFEQLYTYG